MKLRNNKSLTSEHFLFLSFRVLGNLDDLAQDTPRSSACIRICSRMTNKNSQTPVLGTLSCFGKQSVSGTDAKISREVRQAWVVPSILFASGVVRYSENHVVHFLKKKEAKDKRNTWLRFRSIRETTDRRLKGKRHSGDFSSVVGDALKNASKIPSVARHRVVSGNRNHHSHLYLSFVSVATLLQERFVIILVLFVIVFLI